MPILASGKEYIYAMAFRVPVNLEQRLASEFRRGATEGKEVNSRLRDLWGFNKDPLDDVPPIRDVLVDREDVTLRLARAIGRASVGGPGLLACVGALGVGVSSVLRVVHDSLAASGVAVGVLVRGSRFTEESPGAGVETSVDVAAQTYFDDVLRTADFTKVRYVMIDEADEIAPYLSGYIHRIQEKSGAYRSAVTVVVGLHVSGWLGVPLEVRQALSEQVWVSFLTAEQIRELLLKRIGWSKGRNDLSPFTEDSLARVVDISCGLPWAAITLYHQTIREAALRRLDKVSTLLVEETAKTQGVIGISALLELMRVADPLRIKILAHLAKNPDGATGTQLGAALDINRTTVNYHLGNLEALSVLVKVRRGREVFYVPSDAGRRAIECGLVQSIATGVSSWNREAS